jgi:hypothetical protein
VSVTADGLECAPSGREVNAQTGTIAIGCTRTDQPSGRVSGRVAGVSGERRLVTFTAGGSHVDFETVARAGGVDRRRDPVQ